MLSKEKKKLQDTARDMKAIIDNIDRGFTTIEQVKRTLQIMTKECEKILSE